jgi:hypothetical protein
MCVPATLAILPGKSGGTSEARAIDETSGVAPAASNASTNHRLRRARPKSVMRVWASATGAAICSSSRRLR